MLAFDLVYISILVRQPVHPSRLSNRFVMIPLSFGGKRPRGKTDAKGGPRDLNR